MCAPSGTSLRVVGLVQVVGASLSSQHRYELVSASFAWNVNDALWLFVGAVGPPLIAAVGPVLSTVKLRDTIGDVLPLGSTAPTEKV